MPIQVFSSNVADLIAAARFLENERSAPKLLVGHSLGGTAVLQAASDIPSALAVATIGSPSAPTHVAHLFEGSREELKARGEAVVELGGRPFRIKQDFLDDLEKHPMPESIGSLRKALLIMHAPLDDVVEIDNASELFAEALHPKSFVSLDDADHLLTREQDSLYAGQVLAAWAQRYLALSPASSSVAGASDEVVARTAAGGFLTELSVAGHAALADEPKSYGGTNLGPTPYDYLSAALAACTTMTLQMYAKHKKLALDSATVRVHAPTKFTPGDCVDCENHQRQDRRVRPRAHAGGRFKRRAKSPHAGNRRPLPGAQDAALGSENNDPRRLVSLSLVFLVFAVLFAAAAPAVFRLFGNHLVDVPLLGNRQQGIGDPVEHQPPPGKRRRSR